MSIALLHSFREQFGQSLRSLLSSVIFYTILPLPERWTRDWQRIARWSPLVGMIIGSILGLLSIALQLGNFPNLTRSAVIVAAWVGITGGLHLDGAMDTADGLGVTDAKRRLEVMRDSATGAYGAIVAVIILLLKTMALSETTLPTWLVLILAASWARWGQVAAIAFYPYLRKTGKGAFHKENLRSPQDLLLGLMFIVLFVSLFWWLGYLSWWLVILLSLGCSAIALSTGYYFYWQLAGHTGDTYGAVVEWTEVLILCLLTAL